MGELWRRVRFHLSALVVLVPLPFLPQYLAASPPPVDSDRHQRLAIGPFQLDLSVHDETPEMRAGGWVKEIHVGFGPDELARIRAVFLRVGRPAGPDQVGILATGAVFRPEADVILPAALTGTEEVWVTVEAWDGSRFLAALPLAPFLDGWRP